MLPMIGGGLLCVDCILLATWRRAPLSLLDGSDFVIGVDFAEGGRVPGVLYGSGPPVVWCSASKFCRLLGVAPSLVGCLAPSGAWPLTRPFTEASSGWAKGSASGSGHLPGQR